MWRPEFRPSIRRGVDSCLLEMLLTKTRVVVFLENAANVEREMKVTRGECANMLRNADGRSFVEDL
jgi:hypothetical protein